MDQAEEQLDTEATNERLTDWAQEPSVRELKQDLLEAQSVHDTQVAKIDGYLDNLYVRGSAKVDAPKGRSKIVPKLIRKQAEWRYASLSEPFLSTDDLFKAHPVTWADKQGAQQNQLVLNSQFNFDLDKVAFIDEYVRTGVDEGTIIVKTGWEFEEQEYEVVVPVVEYVENPDLAQLHEGLAELKANDPARYEAEVPDELKEAHDLSIEKGFPVEPIITDNYTTEIRTRTIQNHPTAEICDYRNVIIDPTCKGDIDKAGFVIFRFESSLSELEKDGKYTNLGQINVDNNTVLSEPDHANENSANFNFSDKARKRIVVHEYWGYRDLDGSGVVKPFVAAWVGDTLIRMEENPFPDQKVPFVVVQLLPVRRSIYGEPDGALLEDNQKIMGAITRGMIDIMGRSANGQMGIRKDALDPVNKRRFRMGENYEFNANVDPRQGMYMHTWPEIPASAQFMLESQNMEAESLTGVKAYNNGVSANSLGDVAAGIRGALDAASKRELGILRRLSNGLIKIGQKFLAMNQEFLDESEVVRITDEEFVQVSRDQLAGKYDLKLDIATAEEDNAKAQELAFMLQTMGNNLDFAMSQLILAEIARLRKMPALAKMIEKFQPQPDPLEQKIKELEAMKLQAEITKIQSETKENLAGASLDMAKAGQVQSETDKTNLDFVEQESGVTQARDLQKMGEQARANMQLEQFKHNLSTAEERRKELKKYMGLASS